MQLFYIYIRHIYPTYINLFFIQSPLLLNKESNNVRVEHASGKNLEPYCICVHDGSLLCNPHLKKYALTSLLILILLHRGLLRTSGDPGGVSDL